MLTCAVIGALVPLAGSCVDDGTEALAIVRVSPNVGSLAGGTAITVEGRGFDGESVVEFRFPNETPPVTITLATPTVVSSRLLLTTTPVLPPAPFSSVVADVVVRRGTRVAIKAQAYTYQSQPPTLSSVAPATGPVSGGTTVTLAGSGFLAGATVTFDGVAGTSPTWIDPNTLTAVTPPHAIGSGNVVVHNPDAQSSSQTVGFAWVGPPVPTFVSPAIGPTVGGTRITITGTDFQTGANVTIAGVSATDVLVSPGSIVCTTPTLPNAGSVTLPSSQNVQVINPDSQIGTLTSAFTYRFTRLYVSHAGTPNTLMVINYDDTTPGNSAAAFVTPAASGANGGGALASYTDPGLGASVDAVVYVAGQTSNDVRPFTVASGGGSGGTVTAVGTGPIGVGTGASGPVLLRVVPDGSGGYLLYALCTSGHLSVYPITTSTGALGAPTVLQLTTNSSTSVSDWVISGSTLYVADPGADELHAVTLVTPTAPALLTGSPVTATANRGPTVLHVFPGGQWIYTANTGSAGNNVDGYTVGPSPPLSSITGGPFATGTLPLGMADDGLNLFVASSVSGTVTPFTVSTINGVLTSTTAATTGTGPALLQVRAPHLYALNLGSNDISGYSIGIGAALTEITTLPPPSNNSPFGLGTPSAVVTWHWGADRVFVLDAGQLIHVPRVLSTGALGTPLATTTGGTGAADLLISD